MLLSHVYVEFHKFTLKSYKELCALSLGARFLIFVANTVSKYFRPASLHLWSDRTAALPWDVSRQNHNELFVRSMVANIIEKNNSYSIKTH